MAEHLVQLTIGHVVLMVCRIKSPKRVGADFVGTTHIQQKLRKAQISRFVRLAVELYERQLDLGVAVAGFALALIYRAKRGIDVVGEPSRRIERF